MRSVVLERRYSVAGRRYFGLWQNRRFLAQSRCLALLGVIDWTDQDYVSFELLTTRPRAVFVANPDVASPQTEHFLPEPGYWMARAMQANTCQYTGGHYIAGKPYRPAFDLALDRLNKLAGRCSIVAVWRWLEIACTLISGRRCGWFAICSDLGGPVSRWRG